MKRQKRKQRSAKSSSQPQSEQPQAPQQQPAKSRLHRRDMLVNIGIYSAGAAVILGGGGYLARDVVASVSEHDLSTLGNGVPAVVQIHDPNCSLCTALQREARSAACEFDDGSLQFLVANLQTPEGRQLASQHGVGSVTLLLFDGDGQMQSVLAGSNTAENLKPAFALHVEQYANRQS